MIQTLKRLVWSPLDPLAALAIKLLLLSVGVVTIYLHRPVPSTPRTDNLTPGIRLPIIKLKDHKKSTLIIAVTDNCPECEDSRKFHEDLLQQSRTQNTQAMVLAPDISASPIAIGGLTATKAHFGEIGIIKPPTVILVQPDGMITDMWAGKPTELERQRAFKRLAGVRKDPVYLNGDISEEAWSLLEGRYSGVLLDIKERDEFAQRHRPSAVNMPLDELESRARHELDQQKPIIIDCTFDTDGRCRVAGSILSIMGFESVGLLNPGSPGSCPAKSAKS